MSIIYKTSVAISIIYKTSVAISTIYKTSVAISIIYKTSAAISTIYKTSVAISITLMLIMTKVASCHVTESLTIFRFQCLYHYINEPNNKVLS